MKKVLVVFTGGTFSMKINESGGAVPHYSGEQLIDKIPGTEDIADIEVYNYGKYPGPHMTPGMMCEVARIIREKLELKSYDGVVVTHGTDTLEETAYMLDLTIKSDVPVVVTGSMKNSSEPDWDGPRNLIDSILTALHPNARGLGTLVCLNGEVNAASEVTKTHTENVETFHSLDFGSLGFVQEGRVWFNRLPRIQETITSDSINDDVDLIKCCAGMDDKFFRYSADSGTEGLVVEAMGIGNVPPKAYDGIKYAVKKGVITVLVSRCPAGETLDLYGYPGAGKHLRRLGLYFQDYLNGQKARIKLMLALGKTKDRDELSKIFSKKYLDN